MYWQKFNSLYKNATVQKCYPSYGVMQDLVALYHLGVTGNFTPPGNFIPDGGFFLGDIPFTLKIFPPTTENLRLKD